MQSLFGKLVQDSDSLALFAPFCDCTETQQDELLSALVARAKAKRERKAARKWHVVHDPAAMYKRIESRIRTLLKKRNAMDWPFVEDLETSIAGMLPSESGVIEMEIESSYHRLIARGVCQYYDVDFESVADEDGEGAACIIKRKDGPDPEVPPVTLLRHIQDLNTVRTMTHAAEREDSTGRKPRKSRNKKKADPALAARLQSLKVH